jgi:hypothetical protein
MDVDRGPICLYILYSKDIFSNSPYVLSSEINPENQAETIPGETDTTGLTVCS